MKKVNLIMETQDLIHKQHLGLELAEEYNRMIDEMLKQEGGGTSKYASFESIKNKYQPKRRDFWFLEMRQNK
jgi:hypothetical protein